MDATFDDKQNFEQEKKGLISEISDQNNILTKMRSMLLSDDINLQDYKIMKSKCDKNDTCSDKMHTLDKCFEFSADTINNFS